MVSALAITGGRIVTPEGVVDGGVLVRDGRIAAIGAFDIPGDAERIDAAGKLIAPGLIDVGVFAIDPPAFAAGGITRAVLMPDRAQPIETVALVQHAAAAGKPRVWVHPLAAATRGLAGAELAEIGLMREGGACGVATGRQWVADSGVMHRLLGYAGAANDNVIVALQVETASCIKNIDEIAAVPGVDMLFLGQNDLCMSMGLYEKYKFPDMYTSPELGDATSKLIAAAQKNDVILGIFLFGTARVAEFQGKGFRFISVGNDLHHILTQASAYVKDMETIAAGSGKTWARRSTALM